MNAQRTAVILDMTYNQGSMRPEKWPKFSNAVGKRNWNEAADEIMNSLYAKQTKSRAVRNSAIMRDG
jgi:lysozyme